MKGLIEKLYETDMLWFFMGCLVSDENLYDVEDCEKTLDTLNKIQDSLLHDTPDINETELEKLNHYVNESINIVNNLIKDYKKDEEE